MLTSLLRYWPFLSIALILALFAGSFFVPDWANAIAGAVVVVGLSIAIFSVIQKHIRLYRTRATAFGQTLRNIVLELTGILLAMFLAALLGRYIAEISTRQIGNEWTKLIVGIVTGMLVGIGVGILVRRAWGQLVGMVS